MTPDIPADDRVLLVLSARRNSESDGGASRERWKADTVERESREVRGARRASHIGRRQSEGIPVEAWEAQKRSQSSSSLSVFASGAWNP